MAYVSPGASLANAWDTRLGGVLADAVPCNAVVKAFGAETREEARLDRVVAKWWRRTHRFWMRGTMSGTAQGAALLVLRGAVIGPALVFWARGNAGPGDIAFVPTAFFVLQGYLRDLGRDIANLQRSVNDLEELVDMPAEPLGVEDRAHARRIRVSAGPWGRSAPPRRSPRRPGRGAGDALGCTHRAPLGRDDRRTNRRRRGRLKGR